MERQAVQWVDGPKKTGGDGTGSDDRGMKEMEPLSREGLRS